jgi:hypothetical protein
MAENPDETTLRWRGKTGSWDCVPKGPSACLDDKLVSHAEVFLFCREIITHIVRCID